LKNQQFDIEIEKLLSEEDEIESQKTPTMINEEAKSENTTLQRSANATVTK